MACNSPVCRLYDLIRCMLQVGWPRRPPAKVEAALRNSYMTSTLTVRISQPGKPAEESMVGAQPTGFAHIF